MPTERRMKLSIVFIIFEIQVLRSLDIIIYKFIITFIRHRM